MKLLTRKVLSFSFFPFSFFLLLFFPDHGFVFVTHAMMRHFPNVDNTRNVREMPFWFKYIDIAMCCFRLCE